MSKVHQRGPAKPEMNLTPLIDVVFQLIIFFMLVNQIVAEQLVEMIVPAPSEPRTRQISENDDVIMVNIAPQPYNNETRSLEQPLEHDGTAAYINVDGKEFAIGELQAVTELMAGIKSNRAEVQVVLRADMALFYEEVQPIMEAVKAAGIETVNLAAYTEEADFDLE